VSFSSHLVRLTCAAALTLVACDSDPTDPMMDATAPPGDGGVDAGPDPSQVGIRFEPGADDFYRMPWPSDARTTDDGHPDLSDFPRRRPGSQLGDTLSEIERTVVGFANMSVAYFSLSAPVEDGSLPSETESIETHSPIQLVDLSEAGCGERVPVEIALATEGDQLRPPNILQVANAVGTVLAPGRPYGVLILRSFGEAEGRSTPRPAAFDDALSDASGADRLAASLEPLRRCAPDGSIDLDQIAVATVFTPQDPVAEMARLRAHVVDPSFEVRDVAQWRVSEGWSRRRMNLRTWVATVQMPMFQEGETPYTTEGGALVFDDAGEPVIQRWEEVDIAVAMRTIEPPPEGPRPVLVFLDGTGWTPWGHLNDNWIAEALDDGYVVMSFMPQFHGGRAGLDLDRNGTSIATFNIPNPPAGRSNFRQQAAEASYFIRILRDRIDGLEGLPELDTENLVYGGHSQGALVGSFLAAVEDQFRGYIFNGLSSYLTETILYRTDLLDFQSVVKLLYAFTGELDRFHPLLQMIQLGAEVVDPHNYVPRWHGWSGNPDGNHVYVVNGYEDDTTTPRGMEHMTMAADMSPIDPPGWEIDPVGVWDGVPVSLPVMGNDVAMSDRPLTIATLLDFDQGHGTIYRNTLSRQMAHTFWRTARAGTPELSSVNEFQCGDGADEDLDGLLDCDDPDCAERPPCVEDCANDVDDDGNGLTDCDDPRCTDDDACTERECGDEMDEDNDGLVDCDDPDCDGVQPCGRETSCRDRTDNDGDGMQDCDDPDCARARNCYESSCGNEEDDDGDGLVDCEDDECLGSRLCPETMCGDGADDDGNGLTDCADPGCATDAMCIAPAESDCGNATDDDGDGVADCGDADCALEAACAAATCAHGDLGSQVGFALYVGSILGRANDYPPGDCTPLGGGDETPDIAFAWTAPEAGTYVVSTFGSSFDTILTVLGDDCDPLNELACDDDGPGVATSELELTVEAGQSVVIVLNAYRDFDEEDTGDAQLHIWRAP